VLVEYLSARNTRDRATCQTGQRKEVGKRTSTALNSFVQTVATPLKNCAICQSLIHLDTRLKEAIEGRKGTGGGMDMVGDMG
jgi:hypothetical protein